MKFENNSYVAEMKLLVDHAFDTIKSEKPAFQIYTISIWTDPSSSVSSVSFDNQVNSDKVVAKANQRNEKYHEYFTLEGDTEQAKGFEPINGRNTNPADFELRDFVEIKNITIPENWEEFSEGECWRSLEPALQEVGEYAFAKSSEIYTCDDFELSVNGEQDWYEFTWNKE